MQGDRSFDRRDAPAQPPHGRRQHPLRGRDRGACGRQYDRLGLEASGLRERRGERPGTRPRRARTTGRSGPARRTARGCTRAPGTPPSTMNAQIHGETSRAPSTPSATAPARPTAASAQSTPSGIRVPSGRPCNSSSACAATPIARKNAIRVSTSHRMFTVERDARAHHHVREVPERVRRMQQRPVVAPTAGRERVERRALARQTTRGPSFTAQMTMPAPSDMARVRT